MELVGQREIPEAPSLSTLIASQATSTTTAGPTTQPKPAANLQAEYVHRAAWKAAMMGTLNVLIAVIAVRFALLVSIIGAIVLTYITIEAPDPWRLAALGVYTALVVLPATWLASRR
jgi:hypothetical protein